MKKQGCYRDAITALAASTPELYAPCTVAKNLAVVCSPAKKTRLPTGVRKVFLQWIKEGDKWVRMCA